MSLEIFNGKYEAQLELLEEQCGVEISHTKDLSGKCIMDISWNIIKIN